MLAYHTNPIVPPTFEWLLKKNNNKKKKKNYPEEMFNNPIVPVTGNTTYMGVNPGGMGGYIPPLVLGRGGWSMLSSPLEMNEALAYLTRITLSKHGKI